MTEVVLKSTTGDGKCYTLHSKKPERPSRKASQSNMCVSSWKGYTIPAAVNLIWSNLTGLRDSKYMDKA